MSAAEEIRAAIQRLSLEERAQITAELCGWTDDKWDCEMREDAAAGKFAALNQEADRAQAAAQTRPLNDLLHEP
jgi:hypothetical protein